MLYDIEVRPGPNTGFFQYYTETVEANTSHDAIARVQRANPGCQVRCCRSYNKPNESNGFSFSSGEDTSGYLILGAILFCIWFLVEYWWIVVPVLVIIGLLVWYGNEN